MVHEVEQMKAKPYKKTINSLMFAMIAPRPNLVTLVGIMNKYMQSPTLTNSQAMKWILKYL